MNIFVIFWFAALFTKRRQKITQLRFESGSNIQMLSTVDNIILFFQLLFELFILLAPRKSFQ